MRQLHTYAHCNITLTLISSGPWIRAHATRQKLRTRLATSFRSWHTPPRVAGLCRDFSSDNSSKRKQLLNWAKHRATHCFESRLTATVKWQRLTSKSAPSERAHPRQSANYEIHSEVYRDKVMGRSVPWTLVRLNATSSRSTVL